MSSPRTEISEDEASDDGNFPIKEEKSTTGGKGKARKEVVEETQEPLRVESDKEENEEEEDDDDERGPDEYASPATLKARC